LSKKEVCARIEEIGIMPSVRVGSSELALFAAEAVYEAGIHVAKITNTVPDAVEVIAQLAQTYPDFIVGAGTVLDMDTARRCVDAGARLSPVPA
jgi:2-dehydro-3-deoxyphosphogluconate aldolase/(4S)-4-hydroxy-2-oxoglutarate aldolase